MTAARGLLRKQSDRGHQIHHVIRDDGKIPTEYESWLKESLSVVEEVRGEPERNVFERRISDIKEAYKREPDKDREIREAEEIAVSIAMNLSQTAGRTEEADVSPKFDPAEWNID
ncbi:MAG: hypothetical protein IH867_13400 [Chloroflexi bacterium]|nr:hypothetical protein [Chloroflexota bacterium]